MPLPAALRTQDTVPEGQRVTGRQYPDGLLGAPPGSAWNRLSEQPEQAGLPPDAQVWVVDDNGGCAWPGRVVVVFNTSAEIHYGGSAEIFGLPDGRRGSRWLLTGPVACRGCEKMIVPSPPGAPRPGQWEDPDGFTQCMKATELLPLQPFARVMHAPVPRISRAQEENHG
jgi:hypothetical protein